jgi:hypothetical protein
MISMNEAHVATLSDMIVIDSISNSVTSLWLAAAYSDQLSLTQLPYLFHSPSKGRTNCHKVLKHNYSVKGISQAHFCGPARCCSIS